MKAYDVCGILNPEKICRGVIREHNVFVLNNHDCLREALDESAMFLLQLVDVKSCPGKFIFQCFRATGMPDVNVIERFGQSLFFALHVSPPDLFSAPGQYFTTHTSNPTRLYPPSQLRPWNPQVTILLVLCEASEAPRERSWAIRDLKNGVQCGMQQLHPNQWDLPRPEPDEKGTLDPQAVKHWRYFEQTRDFLRHRYAEHGILAGPRVTFNCLVPAFQKPLSIPAEKRKRYKLPKDKVPPLWYLGVLRMLITPPGNNSEECQRTKCKLSLHNEKRISPSDVYSSRTNQHE